MIFNSISTLRRATDLEYIILQNRFLFNGRFTRWEIYTKVTSVDVDSDTLYLLPPSIQEWLQEQHLARFVVEIAEQINLQPLKASYRGRGAQPYNPEMLVGLLFYGYATGVFSSREKSFLGSSRKCVHDMLFSQPINSYLCASHYQIRIYRLRGSFQWISRNIETYIIVL
jgi:hypothetical protein